MYTQQWGQYGEYGSWGPGMMGQWGGGHDFLVGVLALAVPFIIVMVLWSLLWKGLALWHAARRGQYWWFAIILVVNTLGILEIIYLFFIAKIKLAELFATKEHHHEHTH